MDKGKYTVSNMKHSKSFGLLFLCLGFQVTAPWSSATQQIEDKIVYKAKTNDLVECGGSYGGMQHGFFLEQYFEMGNPRPKEPLGFGSTGCVRGYVATWDLKNEKLYLTKLETEPWPDRSSTTIPLTKVFPDATNKVFASWVTAQIRIPKGKELPFHNEGRGSNYESDLYVNLTNGVVESSHEVHNLGEYALLSLEHIKWIMSADKPVEDDKSYLWDDLREVATMKYYLKELRSKYPLRTRGFLRVHDDGDTFLYVDDTRLTPYVSFWLHDIPKEFSATNRMPVEIKATFYNTKKYSDELDVKTIRYLDPGEAIHHPYYKLKLQEISPIWEGTLFER